MTFSSLPLAPSLTSVPENHLQISMSRGNDAPTSIRNELTRWIKGSPMCYMSKYSRHNCKLATLNVPEFFRDMSSLLPEQDCNDPCRKSDSNHAKTVLYMSHLNRMVSPSKIISHKFPRRSKKCQTSQQVTGGQCNFTAEEHMCIILRLSAGHVQQQPRGILLCVIFVFFFGLFFF